MPRHQASSSLHHHTISSLQVFKALFRILFRLSAILFKRRLIVLAISSVDISLLTYRRVTSALPVILLRSARASQGKNLSIRIFTFLLLLLVTYNSPTLYRGSRYRSSTSRPTFFFTYFTIAYRPLLQGRLRLEVYLFINYLQLFLTSFFRVFFSQFFISLYYLLSLGLQLLKYFLLTRRLLAIRTAYYTD